MKPQIGKRKLKPSGIDWIGDVPEGWGVQRVGLCFRHHGSGTTPASTNSAYYEGENNWVQSGDLHGDAIYKTEKQLSDSALQEYSLTVYKAPFIAVAMYGASIANTSKVMIDACTNQACCVLYESEEDFDLDYCFYAIRAARRVLIEAGRGGGQPNINRDVVRKLKIPIPSFDEQKRIAAKLDRLCGRVDELAANLTKEIAALQDYRKSLITECVTKGLNPKAKMKPSGVEWIGKIPAGWTVMRLKYACSTITDGSHFSPECVDDGYPYVTATDVRGVGIDFERTKFVSEADYQALVATGCGLKRDDVLMVKDGATTGRVGMMTDDTKAVALSSVAILRTPEDTDRKFLYWGLQSDGLQRNIQQTMAGSAMPRITVWKLGQYNIALPSIDEQKEIVAYLDKHCAVIDAKIEERKGQLEKLAEYRSSAIYEYVTGKKEVAA